MKALRWNVLMSNVSETLRWQFDLAWKLADYHLPHLTDEACLWEPAPGAWTVRRSEDGNWRPDWSESEPDPAPPVTIGWLTWHWIWWWSSLLAALQNEPRTPREQTLWPGSAEAVRARLDLIAAAGRAALASLREEDLARPLAYPWPEPRPLARALAWANMEMMKNVAEIGVVRHLFEAQRDVR
jgi:hypothetical protein